MFVANMATMEFWTLGYFLFNAFEGVAGPDLIMQPSYFVLCTEMLVKSVRSSRYCYKVLSMEYDVLVDAYPRTTLYILKNSPDGIVQVRSNINYSMTPTKYKVWCRRFLTP